MTDFFLPKSDKPVATPVSCLFHTFNVIVVDDYSSWLTFPVARTEVCPMITQSFLNSYAGDQSPLYDSLSDLPCPILLQPSVKPNTY